MVCVIELLRFSHFLDTGVNGSALFVTFFKSYDGKVLPSRENVESSDDL